MKFGKTEAGTIWLDPARTSPFKFYQFWLNTDDRDVVTYLKYFTFLDRAAIEALEAATKTAPEKREAQRVLAREVTALVHGPDQVTRAEHASSVLFGEDIATLDADDVLAVFEDVPSTELPGTRSTARGWASSISWRACSWRRRRRGAAARAIGRRLREQSPRRGSPGADHARSGDRRAVVRVAEGPEAESSRPADLTASDRYEILAARSVRVVRYLPGFQ